MKQSPSLLWSMILGITGSCQSWRVRGAISESTMKPSVVPPPLLIPLTSTPLTTGTVFADDGLLRVDGSVVMR
jgi:hypothetical protein